MGSEKNRGGRGFIAEEREREVVDMEERERGGALEVERRVPTTWERREGEWWWGGIEGWTWNQRSGKTGVLRR